MRYTLELARSGLRVPRKFAQALIARDLNGWLRVQFLGAALHTGLLHALTQPRTIQELAAVMSASDVGLLRSLLEAGAALGEFRNDGGRWRLRGARAKALADAAMDPMAGILEEAVAYDTDVYLALGRRLKGEKPGDYLAENAEVVARASRLAEPVLGALVRDVVRRHRSASVLDVGCGTGIYLRHAAAASKTTTGVGVDFRPEVVAMAQRNLESWRISNRFSTRRADLRDLPADLSGPWDLVLLFQNIYYFPPEERPGVLARLRALAPNGVVVVASAVSDANDPIGSHLDIVLRSTLGNYPLPVTEEIRSELTSAGFSRVDVRRLAPRQPLRAFVARSG